MENHGAATNSVAAARNYDGPGATRFRDGRTTARPLKLRRGPAAPAAHTRARAPNPESAQADLAQNLPELGFEQETCGKHRELKRKLSERAPTQRKARAREEPSPGPPASETDARPLGHQPRGGALPRPRLSRGPRQGGTEPGTARFKDGRATTGPPAPRRGPGAPAVQPRPRGLDLESAQV